LGPPGTCPRNWAGGSSTAQPEVTLCARPRPGKTGELGGSFAEKKPNFPTGPRHGGSSARGVSVISEPGRRVHDPWADAALFGALKKGPSPTFESIRVGHGRSNGPPSSGPRPARALLKRDSTHPKTPPVKPRSTPSPSRPGLMVCLDLCHRSIFLEPRTRELAPTFYLGVIFRLRRGPPEDSAKAFACGGAPPPPPRRR